MLIPKPPFYNVIADMLYTLFFQGDCVKYDVIIVDDAEVKTLTIPSHARYAVIVVEANTSQFNKDLVVRFREDGKYPDANTGMPLGDMGVYEVKGNYNMTHFKVVGIEPGLQHIIRIQFFG